ncbi:hypothetical protein MLD38_022386 [Melastoma candidum]|uniref:Uncharacterized protein n=1 Tax=Melastoma candidum TaxID=119954 RepID=A0ACB9QJL2_9MYRT|nr:hypothetical protein MLD38_022386 [Melastoma candidum]
MERKSTSTFLVFLFIAFLAIGSEVASARRACGDSISSSGCNLNACKSACKAKYGKVTIPQDCKCEAGSCFCKYYC